ncbi:Nucleoside-diphosphate-sugar epimerase [Bradyrhizobium erythrophlei]|nr:Nucleoside-diphosphate-sugar epimerase [Bradyrhizobium erythrophlei]
MKRALVIGAAGVIGGAIVRRLAGEDGWDIVSATRAGAPIEGTSGLAVDLLDDSSVAQARGSVGLITHLFFAAYQSRPSRTLEIEPNLALLRNALSIAEAGALLERVVVITGGKHYGLQWGGIKTPARETDPRHLGPNFYYDQEDLLAEREAVSPWSWTNLVPPFVTGFSEHSPMNLVMTLAIFATLSHATKVPLRFPGPASAWNALHHLADADQIADAAVWAAESPEAKNQIFNIANGDPGRWRHVWPVLADYFGLAHGEPLPVPLSQVAERFAPLWWEIAERNNLRQPDINALVDWRWADYMFNTAFSNDVLVETGKIRRAGFHGCKDSTDAMLGRFGELRRLKIIP